MALTKETPDNPLYAGEISLRRSAWQEAHACFAEALHAEETPEALEGLGMASWGLNQTHRMFDSRERAYQLYRQRGDARAASRLATSLALDYLYYRGEDVIASAWLQRAHRLLKGLEPCAEVGWLAVVEALISAWIEHDFAKVKHLCHQATVLGNRLGDLDLEMLALACEGLALVSQGQVSEGMRRLDEATLAAVSGEMTVADAACTACCCLIFACEWTRDFERAVQWIHRLKGLAAHYVHPTQLHFCRIHYASLLIWQGEWEAAETELTTALVQLEASQPALAAEALVRLADLRVRQGRFAEGEHLLTQAESPPFRALAHHFCLLGRASLAMAQSDAETAIHLIERFLRTVPAHNRLERVAGIELLVHAQIACNNCEGAESVLDELRGIATSTATKSLQASLRFAEGLLAAMRRNGEMARCAFEDAIDCYTQSGAPFEAAHARLELARLFMATERKQSAVALLQKALETFQQLGARPSAEQAQAYLEELNTISSTAAAEIQTGGLLTARELEVLRLIATGHSNKRIAEALNLSVRTVERHISNIYNKIGANGSVARATATAYAYQCGLMPPDQV
jgi:LuxR family transcriptional regulator, maltose regulon positive regulatory protein